MVYVVVGSMVIIFLLSILHSLVLAAFSLISLLGLALIVVTLCMRSFGTFDRNEVCWGLGIGATLCISFAVPVLAELAAQSSETERQAALSAKETAESVATTRAGQENSAKEMGVTYADYMEGDANRSEAHGKCQSAVVSSANWQGASRNWIPDYAWAVRNHVIIISGNDVTMKNEFGASRTISYRCEYDLRTKIVKVTSVE